MADWEEIKRLAADFQRTQTSDTLQRISERNCIDIVKKLTDLNLIELIYTCDGKQFITPAHLRKEIEDEIYVNGGRVQIHDLASSLNVDYNHIEHVSKELVRDKPDEYHLILGQIIHSTYKGTLGKQIQDTMMITGQLSIADFAKSLDLPSEFLLMLVKELLPIVMEDFVASQDERTYYTTDMMDRYKSIIAGALSAVSKPINISTLMKRLDIPERIFIPIAEGLIKDGRIDASIESRLFIPAVYAREQNEWINKFYSSNSYIEYDVLSRMDIKQPKAFLRKRFPDGIPLKTCFISPELVSQVESLVEESIASNSWIDISSIIPPSIEADDVEQLLQDLFKKNKQFNTSCLVFNQVNVCSLGYIATCKQSFKDSMETKAQEHLKSGKLVDHFLGGKLTEAATKERSEERGVKQQEVVQKTSDSVPNQKDTDKKEVKVTKIAPQDVEDEAQPTGKEAKRDKNDKKSKHIADDFDDSDEDQGAKKSKVKKSGGGTQGREIKQKAVKKKYIPGNKTNQKANDNSDEELVPSKAPRSNKGRAARRGVSPERASTSNKSKHQKSKSEAPTPKEPLIFMSSEEISSKLQNLSRHSGDGSDELYESIADMIKDELNIDYETFAKQTLDQYLKEQENAKDDLSKNDDIESDD